MRHRAYRHWLDIVTPSDEVRNFGAIFDSTMYPEAFINIECKSSFYILRNINRLRKSLTTMAAKIIIQALVTSKLNYSNFIVWSAIILSSAKVQNYAARIINHARKWDHTSPTLAELHWLPIKQHIDYKILLYVYKAPNCLPGAYLTDRLVHTSRERTWGPLVNNTLIPHVHSLKPMAIEHSSRWHQGCGMNYQKTSEVPSVLKFSRPTSGFTYICRPFIDELTCLPLGFPSVNFWIICFVLSLC